MTSDSQAFHPDHDNSELLRYAVAERELIDLKKSADKLRSSTLSPIQHAAFYGGLTLEEGFRGEVVSPEKIALEDVFAALSHRQIIDITFQSGFHYNVIGDDGHLLMDTRGKSGFNGQLLNEETNGTRSILLEMTEQLSTVGIIPMSVVMRPSDATYSQRSTGIGFVPWTFTGLYSYSVEGSGYTSGRSFDITYQIDVNENGAVCRKVDPSD